MCDVSYNTFVYMPIRRPDRQRRNYVFGCQRSLSVILSVCRVVSTTAVVTFDYSFFPCSRGHRLYGSICVDGLCQFYLVFSLHRMLTIAIDNPGVCLSVCLSVMRASCAKTAEQMRSCWGGNFWESKEHSVRRQSRFLHGFDTALAKLLRSLVLH